MTSHTHLNMSFQVFTPQLHANITIITKSVNHFKGSFVSKTEHEWLKTIVDLIIE